MLYKTYSEEIKDVSYYLHFSLTSLGSAHHTGAAKHKLQLSLVEVYFPEGILFSITYRFLSCYYFISVTQLDVPKKKTLFLREIFFFYKKNIPSIIYSEPRPRGTNIDFKSRACSLSLGTQGECRQVH